MGIVEELEKLGEAEVLRGMAKGLHGQPGSQVRSQVEAWLRLKEFERTQVTPITAEKPEIPLVFLSYDTRDIELVHYIDSILKRVFQDKIRTFIAQRDIKPGQAAFQRMLQDSLAKSRLVLALCTKHSLTSPWLWFESGAGFGRGDFIPMLSGVTPAAIKPPMNIFQGKSLDNKPHIEQLLARVAEITGTEIDTTITDEEFDQLIEICLRLDTAISNSASLEVADANLPKILTKQIQDNFLKDYKRIFVISTSFSRLNEEFKKFSASTPAETKFMFLNHNIIDEEGDLTPLGAQLLRQLAAI